MLAGEIAQALRRATACPTTPSSSTRRGIGRAELRRLRVARHDARARGRRQRLRRQGAVGRHPGDRARRRESPFRARRAVIVGNTVLYGATSGQRLLRRARRRALRRAQQRRHRGRRGRRRSRLRVHDRRHRRRPRHHRPQLRRRHERRRRLRARRGRRASLRRCNLEMVELETVDGEDAATVRALVEEHVARTGSRKRAQALLADWEASCARWSRSSRRSTGA